MKIVTVVGARPQFIKSGPVSKALYAAGHNEFIVHTGQHYDYEMSQVFFEEMGLTPPHVNLGVGSGDHGQQTGQMLIQIEKILLTEKPDWVLVYGDTNSTLAGALAAVKQHMPVAHVEAGLRSFNREMPEEHNRVLTDHCSDMLFCPTQVAVDNLVKEGVLQGVHLVGDTMYDAILQYVGIAQKKSLVMTNLDLRSKEYLLATIHRASNTDNPENLRNIFNGLTESKEIVVLPLHPRTRTAMERAGITLADRPSLKIIPPQGYLDILVLEKNARMILTDSGGIQKEAYWLEVPCVTLREETEWVETVQAGWNQLVGANSERIVQAVTEWEIPTGNHLSLYGDGHAAEMCVKILNE